MVLRPSLQPPGSAQVPDPRFPRQHHSRDFTPIAARLLSGEDGQIVTLREGRDRWIIGRGFEGTWDVLEATLKEYVIRT